MLRRTVKVEFLMAQVELLESVHPARPQESVALGWFVTRLAIVAAGFLSLAPFIAEFTRG
jgi:hypothetical protein